MKMKVRNKMKLLFQFIILNIVNVIMQTVKTMVTVKASKGVAAVVNAVAFGLYTVVTVYMMCELPLGTKAFILALCNLVGVYHLLPLSLSCAGLSCPLRYHRG